MITALRKTPYVVGVDQSANHTAVAIIDPISRDLVGMTLIEPLVRDIERLAYIRRTLNAFLGDRAFALGIHEGYSFGSTHQAFLLGEVGCVVKLALWDHCARVEEAAPTALKKYMAGHGGASKEDMKTAVWERWGVKFTDDNKADAYALAQLGCDLLKPEEITHRSQLEVAVKIGMSDKGKQRRKTIYRGGKDSL